MPNIDIAWDGCHQLDRLQLEVGPEMYTLPDPHTPHLQSDDIPTEKMIDAYQVRVVRRLLGARAIIDVEDSRAGIGREPSSGQHARLEVCVYMSIIPSMKK